MSAATIDDFRRLCEAAGARGLAVELVVSDDVRGRDELQRRTMQRLRLMPRAAKGGSEVAGTPILGDQPYHAARILVERLRVGGTR